VAGRDQLQDQGAEGFGEDDRLAAEPDPRLVIAGVDVAEGEAADRGWPLGVKKPPGSRSPPCAHHDPLCAMQTRERTSTRTIQNGGSLRGRTRTQVALRDMVPRQLQASTGKFVARPAYHKYVTYLTYAP
jgi:hypothetical protein